MHLNCLCFWSLFKREGNVLWTKIQGIELHDLWSLRQGCCLRHKGSQSQGTVGEASLSSWLAESGNDWEAICCVLRFKHKFLLDVWIWVF